MNNVNRQYTEGGIGLKQCEKKEWNLSTMVINDLTIRKRTKFV